MTDSWLKTSATAPITVGVIPLRCSSEPWGAAWPEDRPALLAALAVSAAFAQLVGNVLIHISGDVRAALTGLTADLAAHGISDDDLPRVQLLGAGDTGHLRPASLLPATLAASCEYERRPWVPVFPETDRHHRLVWPTAAAILTSERAATVTVLAETLAGVEELDDTVAAPHRVRIVSTSPIVRRQAQRRGHVAVPRPPRARHLPAASYLIADGRRPDDLALIATAAAELVLVNAERTGAPALRAFGIGAAPSIPSEREFVSSSC